MSQSSHHHRRSSGGRRSKGTFWNANRICLLIIAIIFGLISLLAMVGGFTAGSTGGGNMAQALGQAFGASLCPFIFMSVPLVILLRAGRKRNQPAPSVLRPGVAPRPGFRDVSVTSVQDLPPVCIRCGVATKRITPLRYANSLTDVSPYDWNRVNPLVMIFLVWKFAVYVIGAKLWQMVEKRWKRRQARSNGVLFRIPHCKGCAASHPIVQRHFDFHGRTMILEAHPEFHRQLAE